MIFLIVNAVVFVLNERDKIDGLDRMASPIEKVPWLLRHAWWIENRAHLVVDDGKPTTALQVLLFVANLAILLLTGASLFEIVALPIVVSALYHKRLWDRQEKRRRQILSDYQLMIQYATLHLLAGDSLENALRRAVGEMTLFDAHEKKELTLARRGVMAALRRESARLQLVEVRRLTHYLQISLEKGEAQAYQALHHIGEDFFKMRMKQARKKAQEMSQALLVPILLIFLSILALLVTPSLLTLMG